MNNDPISTMFPAAPAPSRGFSATALQRRRASLGFAREILRNPSGVGAIAQTSGKLADAIAQAAKVSQASRILELGPGAGAVTKRIFEMKSSHAQVLAIEHNAALVTLLKARFPSLHVIHGCAGHLREHVAGIGFGPVDSIVCALPWTIFSEGMQRDILDAAAQLLAPDGVFATISCLGLNVTTRGRKFRRLLGRTFSEVQASPVVWTNLPPAFVYCCTSPVTRSRADTDNAPGSCVASGQGATPAAAFSDFQSQRDRASTLGRGNS